MRVIRSSASIGTLMASAFLQLPTEYFSQVLGRWKKYSSCLFTAPGQTLDQAEENMLGALHRRPKLGQAAAHALLAPAAMVGCTPHTVLRQWRKNICRAQGEPEVQSAGQVASSDQDGVCPTEVDACKLQGQVQSPHVPTGRSAKHPACTYAAATACRP